MTDPILSFQRAAAAAWPAEESEERDGWLLRASPDVDRARCNAALPLAPDADLDPAVVEAWYDERGLPARIQVTPLPARSDLHGRLTAERWTSEKPVQVCCAAPGDIGAPATAVAIATSLDDRWLQAWATAEGRRPDDVVAHVASIFNQLDGRGGWAIAPRGEAVGLCVLPERPGGPAGLFCLAVRSDLRGRGLGRDVLRALAEWAGVQGAGELFLQVRDDNPAEALFEREGFRLDHFYVTRTNPAT